MNFRSDHVLTQARYNRRVSFIGPRLHCPILVPYGFQLRFKAFHFMANQDLRYLQSNHHFSQQFSLHTLHSPPSGRPRAPALVLSDLHWLSTPLHLCQIHTFNQHFFTYLMPINDHKHTPLQTMTQPCSRLSPPAVCATCLTACRIGPAMPSGGKSTPMTPNTGVSPCPWPIAAGPQLLPGCKQPKTTAFA